MVGSGHQFILIIKDKAFHLSSLIEAFELQLEDLMFDQQ